MINSDECLEAIKRGVTKGRIKSLNRVKNCPSNYLQAINDKLDWEHYLNQLPNYEDLTKLPKKPLLSVIK